MISQLIRLVAVAIIANATWHVFTAYSAHYKFRDSVQSASQYSGERSESELASRVLEIAEQFDVPITSSDFTLRRDGSHTLIDGAYERSVEVVPGLSYSWPFTWHIDTVAMSRADSPVLR